MAVARLKASRPILITLARMKIVVAPNALKGSLSPFEAAAAMARGARRALPNAEVVELAIADGGDGTAEVVCRARRGGFREIVASDALGRPRPARYGWLDDGTAVLDVATASGLASIEPSQRSVLTATSYGTGELIREAIRAGANRVVLGVGGSATVDAGAGILQALGARLLNESGGDLPRGGGALSNLSRIDTSTMDARALSVPIEIACDVDSSLLGEHGAARLFGPQKGATAAQVETLEAALSHFAGVVERTFGRSIADVRFGGAAGGIAAGLYGVLGAALLAGSDWVLDAVGFDQALSGADLCITAEGLLDRQSLHHKGPLSVARRAAARSVPTVALCGGIASDFSFADFPELDGAFSICERPISLDEAMREAHGLLDAASERVVRFFDRARGGA